MFFPIFQFEVVQKFLKTIHLRKFEQFFLKLLLFAHVFEILRKCILPIKIHLWQPARNFKRKSAPSEAHQREVNGHPAALTRIRHLRKSHSHFNLHAQLANIKQATSKLFILQIYGVKGVGPGVREVESSLRFFGLIW